MTFSLSESIMWCSDVTFEWWMCDENVRIESYVKLACVCVCMCVSMCV